MIEDYDPADGHSKCSEEFIQELFTELEMEVMRIYFETTKERIFSKLPGKECGLCGAPDCETFAEDCARGESDMTDCYFFKRTSL